MKKNISIDTPKMGTFKTKTLNHRIGFTDKNVQLFYTIEVDGKKIVRRKADSFVAAFASFLNGRICGVPHFAQVLDVTVSNASNFSTSNNNLTVTQDGNDLLFAKSGGNAFSSFNGFAISLKAGTKTINRRYESNELTNVLVNSFRVPNFDLEGNTVASATVIATIKNYGDQNRTVGSFWEIIVGRDNTPVKITDVLLYDRIPNNTSNLQFGNQNHSTQVTTQLDSTLSLNRTFSNNSGSIQQIGEIGIGFNVSSGTGSTHPWNLNKMLFVRDALPGPIEIPDGSNVTITYEIKSVLQNFNQNTDLNGTNGGILALFMSTLDNFMKINNVNGRWKKMLGIGTGGLVNSNEYLYRASASANNSIESIQGDPFRRLSHYSGVVVGKNNQFVSMTDEDLFDYIEPGTDSGQLIKYGTYGTEMVLDEQNQKYSFSLVAAYRNLSNENIIIKETGLNLNDNNSGNNDSNNINRLYARTALDESDQVTVEPGEGLQVTYTFEFVL